jgi:hypothetical protein
MQEGYLTKKPRVTEVSIVYFINGVYVYLYSFKNFCSLGAITAAQYGLPGFWLK